MVYIEAVTSSMNCIWISSLLKCMSAEIFVAKKLCITASAKKLAFYRHFLVSFWCVNYFVNRLIISSWARYLCLWLWCDDLCNLYCTVRLADLCVEFKLLDAVICICIKNCFLLLISWVKTSCLFWSIFCSSKLVQVTHSALHLWLIDFSKLA